MISDTENARRVALGRHAGGFLRALAGERKGALATVLRALASDVERIAVDRAVTIVSGGDA